MEVYVVEVYPLGTFESCRIVGVAAKKENVITILKDQIRSSNAFYYSEHFSRERQIDLLEDKYNLWREHYGVDEGLNAIQHELQNCFISKTVIV